MATSFQHEQTFHADPAAVMAMLRDPDYIRTKCDRTGSMDTTVSVEDGPDGGCVITSVRVLPAKLPSAVKKFVGDTITVTERQEWAAPGPDGAASAAGTVEFSAPMAFTATITLEADGPATRVRTEGSFKASVPFVGGSIEGTAADLTRKYLEVEQAVGNEWLAG
ncbi:MAG: DUF2505 domain-containing protein [Actinomycetota bacterium]|nr:DUF2505 domain-containing protein [Actinomycetota bacterium]